MERHVRNVHNTGVVKFRCELCNFRIMRPYKMMYVGEMHDKIFVCMDCGKSYAVKRSLWRHRKFECVNSKPKFSCEVCPYKSPHKWCIDKHRKKHHAYRKMYMGDQVLGYTCTMCSKFYKMWSNYLKHKCEPPQFKCPLCPFAAFKAFILHAHQAEQHFKVTSPNT
nr:PREDICTED: zinc finger protein 319-like [Linepithema humile]